MALVLFDPAEFGFADLLAGGVGAGCVGGTLGAAVGGGCGGVVGRGAGEVVDGISRLEADFCLETPLLLDCWATSLGCGKPRQQAGAGLSNPKLATKAKVIRPSLANAGLAIVGKIPECPVQLTVSGETLESPIRP